MNSSNSAGHHPTIWKSANNGLIAHLYEHIVVTNILSFMRHRSQLKLADYGVWAKTYGTSMFIETRFQTTEACLVFEQAIYHIEELQITYDMLKKAATECSCEYVRPLTRLDEKAVHDFQALHAKKWQTLDKFTVECATDETSVNTLFELPYIRYGRRTPKSFKTIALEYTIPTELYVDAPAMKALSILVLQAIALNQIDLFYESTNCYDSGDEWAESSKQVAYRTYLTYPKKESPTTAKLKTLYNNNSQLIKHADITKKLAHTIKNNYHSESLQISAWKHLMIYQAV